MDEPNLSKPVVALAAEIRRGALRSEDLTAAHIQRIRAVNPSLNAVVADRFEAALSEAREADAQVARGADLGPLHGVPCTIKEFASVTGMPWTGGTPGRRGVVALTDAPAVARLREAGAIVMGSTNAPEGGLWHETDNPLYGRTSNPWGLGRTCGGSTGGEAAIIAAGGSPFGLGSDVGGSVRIPAAFCGIWAHKPTSGTIPSDGHFPPAPSGSIDPFSFGPMTRSAQDLAPILSVLAGREIRPRAIDWSRLSVWPLATVGRTAPEREVIDGLWRSARHLAGLGARIVSFDHPLLRKTPEMWAALLAESDVSYATLVGAHARTSLLDELARVPFGRARHSGPVLLVLVLEKILARIGGANRHLVRELHQLRGDLEAVLGDDTVILHPTYPRGAPRHRAAILDTFAPIHTALFNVLEFPATQIPVGLDRRGMPIGVQVAAARGRDDLCLAVALALDPVALRFGPMDPKR